MRKLLIITFLFLCLSNGLALADHPPTPAAIYDSDSSDSGPIAGIVNAINKLDAWIRQNLW